MNSKPCLAFSPFWINGIAGRSTVENKKVSTSVNVTLDQPSPQAETNWDGPETGFWEWGGGGGCAQRCHVWCFYKWVCVLGSARPAGTTVSPLEIPAHSLINTVAFWTRILKSVP